MAAGMANRATAESLRRKLTASFWQTMPVAYVQFSVYDTIPHVFIHEASLKQNLAATSAIAGAITASSATLAAYPLDVLQVRMAIHLGAAPPHKSGAGAAGNTLHHKGLSAFYRSVAPSLAGAFRCGAFSSSMFDILTRQLGVTHRLELNVGAAAWARPGQIPIGCGFAGVGTGKGGAATKLLNTCCHKEGAKCVPVPNQQQSAASAAGASTQLHAIGRLVCGGIAGGIAKTVIAPGDRIKIIYQVDASKKFNWRDAQRTVCKIVQREGGRGLWRGHGATLLRDVPYSATSFATFEPYKVQLREAMPRSNDSTVRFLAGAAAGATATSFTYPFDVFRARMATHRGAEAPYHGYYSGLRHIVRAEGKAALWKGLRPTLCGIVPYSGISFCLFETLNARIMDARGCKSHGDLRMSERLASGGCAGLVAQSVTYPLDVVRRRMQVSPQDYRNELQTIRSICRTEGIRGLFKGLSLNWIKGTLGMAVTFMLNDTLHVKLAQLQK